MDVRTRRPAAPCMRWAGTAMLGLALLLGPAPDAGADDIPDAARALYEKAQGLVAKGGEANLKKAFSALSKLKDKAATSVDYWHLYVRVANQLGKKESTTWKIIEKREAAHPKSPAFDLLRARLTNDPEAKRAHLDKAVAKAPDAVRPRLLIIRMLLADDDTVDAEEMLDALLESHPTHPEVLYLRGKVELQGGYPNAAVEFADEHLAKAACPGLHHLKAEAFLYMTLEEGNNSLDDALASAKEATAKGTDPRFHELLVRIHQHRGERAEAKAAAKAGFAKTGAPSLAALEAAFTFQARDYKDVVRILEAHWKEDARAAWFYARASSFLGEHDTALKAARRFAHLVGDASEGPLEVMRTLSRSGKATEALKEVEDLEPSHLRAYYRAVAGDVEGCLSDTQALRADGTWSALPNLALRVLQARLLHAMGRNDAVRAHTRMRRLSEALAKGGLEARTARAGPVDLEARTRWWMELAPALFLDSRGARYTRHAGPEQQAVLDTGAQNIQLYYVVHGRTIYRGVEPLTLRFNRKTITQGSEIDLSLGDSGVCRKGFDAFGEALAKGDLAACRAALAPVIKEDPHAAVAVVADAVLEGMLAPGERAAAVDRAWEALKPFPDWLLGRDLALTLALWAGKATDDQIRDHARLSLTTIWIRP